PRSGARWDNCPNVSPYRLDCAVVSGATEGMPMASRLTFGVGPMLSVVDIVPIYWGVVPADEIATMEAWLRGFAEFLNDSQAAHEIMEAATDPYPGQGWGEENKEGGDEEGVAECLRHALVRFCSALRRQPEVRRYQD